MATQATTTRSGGCHCGRVRYEVDLDLAAGTGKCNCSICRKTRNWGAMVRPDAFRLLDGADALTDYQFGSRAAHWPFCKVCGVRSFGHGDIPDAGGAFYSVNVNTLDDATPEELAAAPVRYANGRDNDWGHAPAEAERSIL